MLPRFLRKAKPAAPATPEGAHEALRAALDGDLAGAERALKALAERDSAQTGPYLALGQLFRRRGEIGRAIRVHQNLLLRPDLDEASRRLALEGLARDFEQGGFTARALAAWRELLARDPGHAGAQRAIVVLLAAQRDFAAAEAERRRFARGGAGHDLPGEVELALRAGREALGEGKRDEARRAAKRALAAERENAAAWALLAEIEEARGRTRAALAAAQRAARLDRFAPPEAYARIARLFSARGEPARHERFLRELAAQRPGDSGPQLALARVHAAQGDVAGALAALEALLARDPDDLDAHAARAELLATGAAGGAAAKALAELASALARHGLLRTERRS